MKERPGSRAGGASPCLAAGAGRAFPAVPGRPPEEFPPRGAGAGAAASEKG